jgi:hypothetical protein
MQLEDKNIYIEFDSGSESLKELKNKIILYLTKADHHLQIRKEAVLIVLLDNSIPNRKGIDDRTNRIRNLMKVLSSVPEILSKQKMFQYIYFLYH